jgi:membrane-associated phospholipid phosphatase
LRETLNMPTRLSFRLAELIIFAFAAQHVGAQAHALPPNTEPGFAAMQSASMIHGGVDTSGNADSNSVAVDAFTPVPQSGLPNAPPQGDEPICGIAHLGRCIKDLGQDEVGVFTSPLRVKPKDAYWLAPLGAATGLAFAYDTDAQQAAGINSSRTNTANTIADFGSFPATVGEGAGIYFIGIGMKNPKLAETGRLGVEAVLTSGTVTLVTKLASNRQRPLQGNGQGDFWPYGTAHWEWDSSFPSDHATATMALARVIAGEYPHWYVMLPAYGFAETVAISRILANQHFPSDVLVGQAVGFLTGSYVLNHRSLYRRGGRLSLATRLIHSVNPIAHPRTRTLGASLEIPLGR